MSAAEALPVRSGAADALDPVVRDALAELLLTMADDEFVSGFTDSEWTGIAPLLEEDVAISSISQDELGHARALYQLLAGVLADKFYLFHSFFCFFAALGALRRGE